MSSFKFGLDSSMQFSEEEQERIRRALFTALSDEIGRIVHEREARLDDDT